MRNILLILCSILLFSCSESTRFQLLNSGKTGIDFQNTVTETDNFNILSYENIYNGAGVGIGDLNNDGLQDIIFAGNQVSPRAYLNSGNFKFRDITSDFAGLTNDQWYNSVTVADVNSDGWADVYITSSSVDESKTSRNRLWINNGIKGKKGPTFTEMAEKFGIADGGQSVNAAFFDYDSDGDPDLYILNNTLTKRMNTSYRTKITDGSAANNDKLFRNNGNGTFTEVTKEAGIVYEGFGLGLAIGDVNKDGFPDIYVSNDYIANDLLYINQGDGTFRNEIASYLSYQTTSSMGNDMADVNNDGNLDLITLDMMPESYAKKKQTIDGFSYLYYLMDEQYGYEHQYLRNMLHIHNGFVNEVMIPFSEAGQMAGVWQSEWSWSPLFADYDNDGDKDLLITNGYPKDLTDKDWARYKLKDKNSAEAKRALINLLPDVKVANEAFENTGNLSFIKKSDWLPDIPSYSHGAAFVDLDNDGDLDYVANNLNDHAFILRNSTVEKSPENSGYLRIKLTGKENNKMAIGAKAELWSNGKYQFAELFLTRGYASSIEPVLHFGIGADKVVDSVKVTWPGSGNISVVKNIKSNQTLTVDEKDAMVQVNNLINKLKSELLFKENDNIISYMHEQKDFNDFFLSQKIIPHKFSQIGPVMARGDLDNDGFEDIMIGSTNKLPTSVFLRKGKKFIKSEIAGLTTQKDFSESDLAVFDVDNDGDNDVIAVAGGYESLRESVNQENLFVASVAGYDNQNEKEFLHYLYENRNGSFIRTPLPLPPFLASVIRPCDFNHDGYTDLFIGSRVKKGKYPYGGDSWLLINNKGSLSVESYSRLNLGMVTDAVWTDYDKDGWEDLLVSREWNSLIMLKNKNGKELVPEIIPELEMNHGIWYSLAAGDFDKDGDEDYIAGNLGENHRFPVSDKYPINLYPIDLENDGITDPLMTGFWKDKNGDMKEFPVNYLEELREQSSFFRSKFDDYTPFSYATLDEMIPKRLRESLEFSLHVNTTSSYIIWNDSGHFRWEKLPTALQVSPIKKILVQDLNGDSYQDIITGGNDYTWDVATGYFDANKGMILINNKVTGKNNNISNFKVLPPSESGMLFQGMIESLLWFKGDPSLLVAGINRSKVKVFELQKK
jgi:hypothetical protein